MALSIIKSCLSVVRVTKKKVSKKAEGGDFDKYYTSYQVIDPTDYSNGISNYSSKSKYNYTGPDLTKTRWNPYSTSVSVTLQDKRNLLQEAGYPVEGKTDSEINALFEHFNLSKKLEILIQKQQKTSGN